MYIINYFGAPKQLISDNAGCFTGLDAEKFHSGHGINVTNTTPGRALGNGKDEQANGVLKGILAQIILDNF